MTIKKVFILPLICIFSCTLLAQGEYTRSKHGFKLDFKLPTAIGNRAFKGIMSGLADMDLSYQFQFEKIPLFVGVGSKYGIWNVESTIFTNSTVNGQMEFIQPFGAIGFYNKPSENIIFELGIRTGYSFMYNKTNNCTQPHQSSGFAIDPKIGFYYKASDLVSIGATVNYNIIDANFSPENLCLDDFPGLGDAANNGNYQYFSIGFGLYSFIPSRK